MNIRGIRGATTVSQNDASAILEATQELLKTIESANPGLKPEDIASAIFTLTPDLNAAYPAKAARLLGWSNVPLICAQELPVPGGLSHCIRVLLHWNTTLPQEAVHHIYLREAASLRPDLNRTRENEGKAHDKRA
ncbi:MAG: chorismate mutase [Anaerolineaceae bacterium]|nr:chorismate mutase [Anaerolineaceae bacterium]